MIIDRLIDGGYNKCSILYGGISMKKRLLSIILALTLVLTTFPHIAFAEPKSNKAKRTILLYACGTDLETDGGMASYNLRQILNANFSADDDVKFIVMTGGADDWKLEKENLVFPGGVTVPEDAVYSNSNPDNPEELADNKSAISNVYNQIWEAKGADAAENAGKLVLLDGDGILGDGATAKRSRIKVSDLVEPDSWELIDDSLVENYEWMNEPDVLRAFIDYGVEKYPAEKYDLILWDHGGGPSGGFCCNIQERFRGMDPMYLDEMIDAFSKCKVIDYDGNGEQDGKFDFIDFDACIMNSVEIDITLSEYMDYLIASPETEPGYGQEYTGWLNAVGENPEYDTYKLGKLIVDNFVAFYDKEEGDGASQDGTLAVIDMNKLMSTKFNGKSFVDALIEFNNVLQSEIVVESLVYDELRALNSSIRYGGDMACYDFGNLLSQLSYVLKEANYEHLHDSDFDDSSAYTEIAQTLMSFIYNPEIMYARGSQGIKTKEQFYRAPDGTIKKGVQETSGMYIYFDPLEKPDQFLSYSFFMKFVIDALGANDPRAEFFKGYLETHAMYGLVLKTGKTVTELVSDGADKSTMNYNTIKEYWSVDPYADLFEDDDEYESISKWETEILDYVKAIKGGEAETKKWLDRFIRQMANEAVILDNVKVEADSENSGVGIITINNIKKQAIDSVKLNVFVDLPAMKSFMQNPAHSEYVGDLKYESAKMPIALMNGTEVVDVDTDKQGYKAAVDWLFQPTSKWRMEPFNGKWYALKDAKGITHITAAELYDDELDIPTGYWATEIVEAYDDDGNPISKKAEVCHIVYLSYGKDKNGEWKLKNIYFKLDNGSWRPIPAEEFTGEYEVWPVVEYSNEDESAYLPISKNSIKLTGETVKNMNIDYLYLNEIPDIGDVDGDRKTVSTKTVISNIYGNVTDITELVEGPNSAELKQQIAELEEELAALEKENSQNRRKIAALRKRIRELKKKINPIKAKGKKVRLSAKSLRDKKKTVSKEKAFSIKKAKGKVTFKKSKGNKKIKVTKGGKIIVQKGLKKGTYTVKVKVKASGNKSYRSATKTVEIKIIVK